MFSNSVREKSCLIIWNYSKSDNNRNSQFGILNTYHTHKCQLFQFFVKAKIHFQPKKLLEISLPLNSTNKGNYKDRIGNFSFVKHRNSWHFGFSNAKEILNYAKIAKNKHNTYCSCF